MKRRLWTLLTISIVIVLLVGCNLPFINRATPVPVIETQIPKVSAATTVPQATSELKVYDPNPELMVAPADTKIETLSAGEYKNTPPPGFRKLLLTPIGGFGGESSCDETIIVPTFQNSPTEYQAFQKDAYGDNLFLTCGWVKDETVKITVTKPDGTTVIKSQVFDGVISISYYPKMDYGMQLGEYSIVFESLSGKLKANYRVVWPTFPGMVKTNDVNTQKYFIYGFQPEEHIYVLAYKKSENTLELSTWRETSVDEKGNLLFENQFAADYLVVAGDLSGSFWSNYTMGIFVGDKIYYKQVEECAGAPTSRLQSFSFATVLEGAPNNVRSSPSKSAELVGTLKPGTVLVIYKYEPVCADGFLWWQITPRDAKEPNGWTAEGQGNQYWLAPLE